MRTILTALSLLAALPTFAASWYVDREATGSNAGTSWANAWTNTTAIVWTSIQPGDTIYLSTSTNRYDWIDVRKSGTSGNPITIKISREPEHNGRIELDGVGIAGNYQFIVIDGSLSDSFTPPTSTFDLGGPALTNNIGIKMWRTDRGIAIDQLIYLNGDGAKNNTFRWLELGPLMTEVDGGNDAIGLRFHRVTTVTNVLVEYCYIHHIRNDGVNLNEVTVSNPMYYDAATIRWCWITETGDDGIQWSVSGLTVENCFLDSHYLPMYHGHPDQLQFAGASIGYFKIFNNIMRNKANSLIIAEHYISEGGTIGPIIIAGNVLYCTRDWYYTAAGSPGVATGGQAYGATFAAWRPNNYPNTNVYQGFWTNFYYLHNTMYYQRTTPFGIGRAAPQETSPTVTQGTHSVYDLRFVGSAIRNNLHVDNKWNSTALGAFNAGGSGEPGTGTNGVYFSTNDLTMTHNVNAGPNKSAAYYTNSFTDMALHGMGNRSTMPAIETNSYTFALDPSDTVARNQGYNLSSLTNQFPELMVDLAGTPRFADGAPDIGAIEYPSSTITNGLLMWLKLDDSPDDDRFDDSSGNGNHGYHIGYLNDHATTNRFPDPVWWTNRFNGAANLGASFYRTNDGWGIYGYSGDYIAITNIAPLQSLTNATIALWGRYLGHPGDYTTMANRKLISAGYAYPGAWSFGLFGNHFTQLRVYTNANANSDRYINIANAFEVSINPVNGLEGDSTNMNHYAFSWSNGVIVTYYNGVAKSTNSDCAAAGVTALTIRGPSGGMTTGFLGIGLDTHNGRVNLTPFDDSGDQYPNHAFHTGWIDDVRIYGRVLSDAEVASVAGGAAPTPTAPAITSQPQNATRTLGQSVTFSVSVVGTTPMTYQWYKNGATISSAEASSYTIPSVQAADAGTYSVRIANSVGSVTSAGAVLTITPDVIAPAIETHPASQSVVVGSPVQFNVVATGTQLNYQWRKNGVNIPGATSFTYSIASASLTDAGQYTCRVYNAAGEAISNPATLIVLSPSKSKIKGNGGIRGNFR